MKEILFGVPIDPNLGPMEFVIPLNTMLVWREDRFVSAMFCEKLEDLPNGWIVSEIPLKIFGDFSLIKKILKKFKIPAGSKVVDLTPDSILSISIKEKLIRYSGKRRKRVVIVDDSSTIRKLLVHLISSFEGWEVVKEIERAEDIPEALEDFFPDVLTLDLNLGGMNGAEAMQRILSPKKIPTLLITSQSIKDGTLVMEALSAGALDYIQKPESGHWELMKEELVQKLEAALRARWHSVTPKITRTVERKSRDYNPNNFLVVIGSSTGGTQALQEIFVRLPANIPPILVTQHIPAGFSKALADRLNSLCPFEIKEGAHLDEIRPGRILIAAGDHHMRIHKDGNHVEIVADPPVNRFRPSVETMFSSLAGYKKKKIIAIMLTGMGKDGAAAMLELKRNGAVTIAQDEASSVVFGMPKEAIKIGAADHVKSLTEIPEFLLRIMGGEYV